MFKTFFFGHINSEIKEKEEKALTTVETICEMLQRQGFVSVCDYMNYMYEKQNENINISLYCISPSDFFNTVRLHPEKFLPVYDGDKFVGVRLKKNKFVYET